MQIITLIAAHHDRAEDIRRLLDLTEPLGPAVVVGTSGDGSLAAVAGRQVTYQHGYWSHERQKRNDLLQLARSAYNPGEGDWLLSLDPDETLTGDLAALPLLLDRFKVELPGYPVTRMEPNGELWATPSKLLRGDVDGYSYLDVGVRWHGRTWNLDPWRFGRGTALPGWPALLHFRSERADTASSNGYYEESFAFEPDLHYPRVVPAGVIT